MNKNTIKLMLATFVIFQFSKSYSSDAVDCNEKSRQHLVSAAKERCGGNIKQGIWSEKVYNATPDQSSVDVIFAFKCTGRNQKNKTFIGLVNINPKVCTFKTPDISSTNLLSDTPLKN